MWAAAEDDPEMIFAAVLLPIQVDKMLCPAKQLISQSVCSGWRCGEMQTRCKDINARAIIGWMIPFIYNGRTCRSHRLFSASR